MASQVNAFSVPLSISSRQQSFRLLELPAALLELIDSPNPPALTVKSADPSAVKSLKPAHAVLCTHNKTWHLRQVQTSNSVLVAQPSSLPSIIETPNLMPTPCVSAIAQCTATLELLPETASPLAHLHAVLLEYSGPDDLQSPLASRTAGSKASLISHLPFSDDECQTAWRAHCAFEASGACWRPSPKVREDVWKAILAAATAEGIELGSAFLAADVLRPLADEEHPITLFRSVLLLLSPDTLESSEKWLRIDRTVCIRWVGKTILSSLASQSVPDKPVALSSFLENWADSLPEAWRGEANLDNLEDHYQLVTPTTITTKGQGPSQAWSDSSLSGERKRKWHDMLKANRK